MLRKCPHDLCGFKVGRHTPCILKVLMSANGSRLKLEISAPLSGLLALSSPHPRPRSVRVHSQSATTTAVCPWPCTVQIHDLAANMSVSSSRTDRDRDLSVAMSGRCASRDPGFDGAASEQFPISVQAASNDFCAARLEMSRGLSANIPQTRIVHGQSVSA